MKDFEQLLETKPVRYGALVVGGILLLIIAFEAGVASGYRDARERLGPAGRNISFRMIAPQMPFAGQGGHGIVGRVGSVDFPRLVLISREGASTTVLLASSTIVRAQNGDASSSTIMPGDMVVVIGSPDQNGVLDANLVRFLPPPQR